MPPGIPEDRFDAVTEAAQQQQQHWTVKNTLTDTTAVDAKVYAGV